MTFFWQKMPDSEFAKAVGLLGPKILRVGDTFWSEVRPCFYRPLLLLREYSKDSLKPPMRAKLGGMQYAVSDLCSANSFLNILIFSDTQRYTIASLDKNRRRQVKLAAQEFEVRRIADQEHFIRDAHPVYLSFQERTRYKVGEKRKDPAYFAWWARAIFSLPHVLVLGGYRDGRLGGVSLSYLIDDSVYYATFFCDDASLESYLSDLMLHTVRLAAAQDPSIRRVYVGMYKGIKGLDDFYTHRGARLFRQPARLEINPVVDLLLKRSMPRQYAQLRGQLPEENSLSLQESKSTLTST